MRSYGSKADLFAATPKAGFTTLGLTQAPRERIGQQFARASLDPRKRGDNDALAALHRAAMTHDDAALAVQRLIDTHAARAQIGLPRRP
ncbi:hypothetical protein [Nonomuraea pusilla]|nr:hypothetical protein [Nonomuraea pusilla]